MQVVSNPFVDYLSRYTTASPDHEAAFDEFLAQAPPPTAGPLRLDTKVEAFLNTCFQNPNPPSVILTGNAGDGKTYLCRQIIAAFTGQPLTDWDSFADQPIEHHGIWLHVVKDLSELGEAQGIAVLQGLAQTLDGQITSHRYLIAANEGRLRDLLGQAGVANLNQVVDNQLQGGVDINSPNLVVINLTAVTTSSFVSSTIQWMTADAHWADCAPCPIRERCPIHHNATRLRDTHIANRVRLLYQILEYLDIHVTVRDMLIHLAYTLTGAQRCGELQRLDATHRDLSHFVYYENVWGGDAKSAFRRKASVVQHLDRFHIGDHSLFEIDDFIVSGGDSLERQAEHIQLFVPAVDINHRRFDQDRQAYIEGGADRHADEEADALMRWLPHCRRKLFFEWCEVEQSDRLIPFLYLDAYLELMQDKRSNRDQLRRDIVLGLNRAFSRLYLTDSTNLYVTTQYIHSTEQPRPLIRLTIPTQGIELRVDPPNNTAYDRDRPDLRLVIAAPPSLIVQGGKVPEPQSWPMNLLLFEYLMRLANGGTFNILAEECELSVRNLKDRLLNTFAREPANGVIEFFVAERRRYVLRKLKIDEQDTIRFEG